MMSLPLFAQIRLRIRLAPLLIAVVSGLGLIGTPAASAVTAPASSPAAPLAVASAAASFSLAPGDIRAAYGLPKTGPAGQMIAVVSAYQDPGIGTDLNAYTQKFGLPACTTANRCFRQLNQRGQAAPLPGPDPTGGNWITESSAGTEVARGVCQSCRIMLVEADSSSKADLSAAVNSAAQAGANIIVTTFTPAGASDDSQYLTDYTHPGSVVVAATGDGDYFGAPNFPSSLPGVIAVGGTSLGLTESDRYVGETAWISTTSGCSPFIAAPAWQARAAASVGCGAKRAVADVAAVADPGALVHVADAGVPGGPWYAAGGTSLAAPIIAGMIGLAGGAGSSEAQRLYQRAQAEPGAFRDVTSGQTGGCIGQAICAARRGFDGPTGLGTPYGLAAFTRSGGTLDPRHPRIVTAAAHGQIHVSGRWIARLGLVNGNAFKLSAALSLRSAQRVRFGGRMQTITFATAQLTLGSLASATASLQVAKRYRSLLVQLGNVAVQARVSLRGLSGRSVTVTRRLRLYAP